jgi:hypothetical protein
MMWSKWRLSVAPHLVQRPLSRFQTSSLIGVGISRWCSMSLAPAVWNVSSVMSSLNLYALDREAFLLAVTGHASSERAAHDLVDARLAELEKMDAATAQT